MARAICFDPGHGGTDPGAVANGICEKEINYVVATLAQDVIEDHGIDVIMTRTGDASVSLARRVEIAGLARADAFVSVHHNAAEAAGARGVEVYRSIVGGEGKRLAEFMHGEYERLIPELPSRGVKTWTGASGRDYHYVIRETAMPAVIVEGCFLTNKEDAALAKDADFLHREAQAIAAGVLAWYGIEAQQAQAAGLTPIIGDAVANLPQAREWIRQKAPDWVLMADLYWSIAPRYGIRPDAALAQAAKETGFFAFGGLVQPEQNNFCGLGATGLGNPGCSFPDRATGVEAHVQHLFAYATDKPLPANVIDPRFSLVRRGSAPYVEWLGAAENPTGVGWAYPGADYGKSIVHDYLAPMIATAVEKEPIIDWRTRALAAEDKLARIRAIAG